MDRAEESQGGHAEIRFAIAARRIAQLVGLKPSAGSTTCACLWTTFCWEKAGVLKLLKEGWGQVEYTTACVSSASAAARSISWCCARVRGPHSESSSAPMNAFFAILPKRDSRFVTLPPAASCFHWRFITVSAAAGGDASAHAAHGLDHGSLRKQGSCFRVILHLFCRVF